MSELHTLDKAGHWMYNLVYLAAFLNPDTMKVDNTECLRILLAQNNFPNLVEIHLNHNYFMPNAGMSLAIAHNTKFVKKPESMVRVIQLNS